MKQEEEPTKAKLMQPLMSASFKKFGESKFDFHIQNFTESKIGRVCVSENVKFSQINGSWNMTTKLLQKDANDRYHLALIFNIKSNLPENDNRYTIKVEVIYDSRFIVVTPDYFLNETLNLEETASFIKRGQSSAAVGLSVKLILSFNSNSNSFVDTNAVCKQILSNNIGMLNDETYSDFTFVVEGKEFKVHKNILSVTSPVFVKLFNSDMQESIENKCIVDDDISSDTFNHMLRFIYGGILPDEISDIAMSLYEAAHYYDIKNLMEICKRSIRLSAANAHDIYIWAELYDLDDLKSDAQKQLNIVEKNLSPETIVQIMKQKEKELLVLKRLQILQRSKK